MARLEENRQGALAANRKRERDGVVEEVDGDSSSDEEAGGTSLAHASAATGAASSSG